MPLENRTCVNCGKIFKKQICPSRISKNDFCSKNCQHEFAHKNKKEGIFICKNCGKEFKRRLCVTKNTKNIFCCQKCYGEFFTKKKEILTCDYCGKKYVPKQNNTKRNNKNYCSRKCYELSCHKQNNFILHNDYAEIIITSKIYGEKRVKIDLEDVEKCKKYCWHVKFDKNIDNFYVCNTEYRKQKNKKIKLLHRYLMNCSSNLEVDHINHNTLDNRKQNLRCVTKLKNLQNKTIYKNNTSGYKGIYKHKNKWKATITVNKKKIFLGSFNNIKEAVIARENAEKKYFI